LRLLFDQNLSPKLVERLADAFPGSTHVSFAGLDRATDEEVFAHALQQGYAVVSKDSDFAEMAQLRSRSPKVVWLRLGNRATREIEAVLKGHRQAMEDLERSPDLRVLELS
jgi:predicted nuclease of predicted toxin-antitoxin system